MKNKEFSILLNIRAISKKCKKSDRTDHTVYGIMFEFDNDAVIYNVTCNCWAGENRQCYDHNRLIQFALEWFDVSFDELEDAIKGSDPYEMAS